MFLFVCTALLAALILGVKLTKDIFPRPLKRWLCKKAVSNWMQSQPRKFGRNQITLNPTTFADTGVLADDQEVLAERPFPITNSALRDEYVIYGTDEKLNGLSVKVIRFSNNQLQADILLTVNDSKYQTSYHGKALSPHEFSLGNLKMEMVEPFRVWRIWYNGILEYAPRQKKAEPKLVHVVLNFLWKALENPMDNRKNGNVNLLASHLSSHGLFGENLPSLLKILPEGYSQMGTLHGNVHITEGHQDCEDSSSTVEQEHQLYLFGFRTRELITTELCTFPLMPETDTNSRRNVRQWDKQDKRLELFAMCEESGHGFRLTAHNDEWTDGRMLWGSYETTFIVDIDCSPNQFADRALLSKLFNIYDTKRTSRVEVWSGETYQLSNDAQIIFLKMTINGKNANGVCIQKSAEMRSWDYSSARKICSNEDYDAPALLEDNNDILKTTTNTKGEYFVEFSNPTCLNVPLVGGKGASLARLQEFVIENSHTEVKTARGFCVTTNLFRRLLELEKFAHVFNSSSGNDQSLKESCSEVMKMIKSSDAEKQLSTLISPWIEKIFGENRSKIRFAVRSSGVLEDGSDLSSAGQNETFLGVSQDFISQKVVECWASLFTAQSVQYRINHGQPAVSEMGVVVQEMVDAATAGVIFTADPRTGNPFQMIMTANYGLGESVVSGSCDPDSITLIRHGEIQNQTEKEGSDSVDKFHARSIPNTSPSRNKWWKDVTIGRKVLGEKRTKVICTSTTPESLGSVEKGLTDDGVKEISITNQESLQFCLDEETAIKLGIVAGEIELFMGHHKPVDIEWAIHQNGQIFILQCRNLTALDAWTDFEILHELDAPLRTKLDQFTTANSGEVLPKAIHTITQTINRCLDFIVQKEIYKRKGDPFPFSPYNNNACVLFKQRLFINMFQTLYTNVDKDIPVAAVCIDLTVFGRQVIDDEIRKFAEERFGISSGVQKLKDFVTQMKMFRKFKSEIEKDQEKYKDFKLDYSQVPKTAKDVYGKMSEDLFHVYHTCSTHLLTTQCSTGSQVFLFLFLSEGKKPSEWSSSIFEDASKLLSVFANVESAEMPGDMNHLSDEIIKHGGDRLTEDFLNVTQTEALNWLRGNEKASQALDNFFQKHGHRGFAEMDIGEPNWKSNPISFLPILRNVLKNKLEGSRTGAIGEKAKVAPLNDDELLGSLSTELKPMTRRLLKFILPTSRNAVACREKSKSLFVKTIGEFKEKYHQLAKLMVEEHLLPSESLVVYLTHFEIGQLINKDTSSTVILQKALKRQKMYPLLEKLDFPEICTGVPQEIDTSIPVTLTDTIQATPVSRGIAKGTAKVCMSVDEASENLKPGDILITHGTDIAWSPFFPILGGVVTELGGLISHGAVVAREYGLPCIVGATNATKIFKTGDSVILDAGKGTLSKFDETDD